MSMYTRETLLAGFKLFYYYPDLVHENYRETLNVPDDYYDYLERQFISQCESEGYPDMISDWVGFDENAPLGQRALQIFGKNSKEEI